MSSYVLLEDTVVKEELQKRLLNACGEIDRREFMLSQGEEQRHKNRWLELAAFYRGEAEFIMTRIVDKNEYTPSTRHIDLGVLRNYRKISSL